MAQIGVGANTHPFRFPSNPDFFRLCAAMSHNHPATALAMAPGAMDGSRGPAVSDPLTWRTHNRFFVADRMRQNLSR